jgi:predicted P-loop ATPase/GTPase
LAQIKIDSLIKENFEIAFKDPERISEEEDKASQMSDISPEKREEVLAQKRSIIDYFLKGLDLAFSIK